MEAALTADQINALFQTVQKQVDAGGGNRTIAGKGVDAAKKVKAIYDYAKKVTLDTGLVKGFDSGYDKVAAQLKNLTGGDAGVMRYVQKYRDFAKAHPGVQKAVYATLVLAVGVAGYVGMGPAFLVLKPAIVGIMKFTDKLLQGEKFSDATVSGLETYTIAGIAQSIGAGVKELFGGGVPTSVPKPIGGGAAAAAAEPDAPKSLAPKFVATAAAKAGVDPDEADFGMRHPGVDAKADLAAGKANLDTPDGVKAASSGPSAAGTAPKPATLPKSFSGPGTINPTTNQWEPYTIKQQGIAPANIADISPEDLKKGNFPGPKTYDTTTKQWKPYASPAAEPASATTAEPKVGKIASISNSTGTDILDAANEDPKVKKVLNYLTRDLDQKFAKIGSGKLGSEVIQNIQKDLMKQVDTLYPDDAKLTMTSGQKKQLVYQLMAKAQDSYIDSSPKLSGIVNDTTSKLFDKISSGSIKSELDLDKFIRSEIIGQNPDLKSTPAITTMLTAKADSLLKTIYSDALEANPKLTKDPEWKIHSIQKYLSKKESVDFDAPALTESQVMEAFRGTMFHKDALTEAQVRRLFQHISEGPWGALQAVGGKIAQAAKAAAGSKVGQAAIKTGGAVAKQIGVTAGNLTNKVTADKLMSAWKAAGSKTDSNDIYEFLKAQGIDENILKSAFDAAGISLPEKSATVSPQYKKISSIAAKLSPQDLQKLIQHLQAA